MKKKKLLALADYIEANPDKFYWGLYGVQTACGSFGCICGTAMSLYPQLFEDGHHTGFDEPDELVVVMRDGVPLIDDSNCFKDNDDKIPVIQRLHSSPLDFSKAFGIPLGAARCLVFGDEWRDVPRVDIFHPKPTDNIVAADRIRKVVSILDSMSGWERRREEKEEDGWWERWSNVPPFRPLRPLNRDRSC